MLPPITDTMLSASLAAELGRLDKNQLDAVLHEGNSTILAGPGAGKTRTLVARIAWLLTITSPRRGVATITYTDAAAGEVEKRLRALGLSTGKRLASSTIHSFCLKYVLPYGALLGEGVADRVLTDRTTLDMWETALNEAKVPLGKRGVAGELNVLGRLRRRLAVQEDTDEFSLGHIKAIQLYRTALQAQSALDFEEMPIRALELLRSHALPAELLVARFPHLVVDEYQDLGPVLHAIVGQLVEAGVSVTAVGDPDQTMFEFDGAHPRYLLELSDRDDFSVKRLKFNYRSGNQLITAGVGALGVSRGYVPDPKRADRGIVQVVPVSGDLIDHADQTVEVVEALIESGTALSDIAILYPGPTDLKDLIIEALTVEGIPHDFERGRRISRGPIGEFIAGCAARRCTGPVPGQMLKSDDSSMSSERSALTLKQLGRRWHRLRVEANLAQPTDTARTLGARLSGLLDAFARPTLADCATQFITELSELVDLPTLVSLSRDDRDQSLPSELEAFAAESLTMAELAGGRAPGRLTLTTYHSSKGREFSAVVLPGLVDGLVPFFFADQPLSPNALQVKRREFYVAVTRAKDRVILLPGSKFTQPWNKRIRFSTWSRFVTDIQAVLNADDSSD